MSETLSSAMPRPYEISSAPIPTPPETPPSYLPKHYSPELVAEIRQYGIPWLRAGAVVWRWNEQNPEEQEFLLIHENRVKVNGVWQDGDGGWNLPCGRVNLTDDGASTETLEAAAQREVLEESGQVVKLGPICHLGQRTDANNIYAIVIFGATVVETAEFTATAETKEISWFDYNAIQELQTSGHLRNAELTIAAIDGLINQHYSGRFTRDLRPTTYRPKFPPTAKTIDQYA